MQDNWYEPYSNGRSGEDWYAPAVRPTTAPQPRCRRFRIIGFSLLAVVILVGSVLLFREKPEPAGPLPTIPQVGDIPTDDSKPDEVPEYVEDFREYFNSFYSPVEQAEECNIPRVKTMPEDLSIQLMPQSDKSLRYQDIYTKCAPWVVAIHAYVSPDNEDSFYWGTGIVMTADGYIITNSHIVEGTSRATVTLWDDRVYEALLVGNDSRSDIAVLKIEATGLSAAEFCVSEELQVGDTVIAIGNPLGEEFRSTMTEGIISGIDRDISYNGATMTLIQTSAPLNEGNSGGPLLNAAGQVIGITNMKMSSNYYGSATIEGVGFAIPSRTVKAMADSILSNGEVRGRPALGITVGAMTADARMHYGLPGGLYITNVSDGSDCQAKDIRPGDILTAVNDLEVNTTEQVLEQVNGLNVGDTLVLTIYRDGKSFDVTVELVDVSDVY